MKADKLGQTRWEDGDGANIPFSHMIVSLSTYCNGVGTAYMVGSLQECRIEQLARGLRATTEIIPF